MESMIGKSVLRFSTSALVLASICSASAQDTGRYVNIHGATLFEEFFISPAQTNDYLDIDADGVVTSFANVTADQLASSFFNVQSVHLGSGNGLAALVNYGSTNYGGQTWTGVNGIGEGDPTIQDGSYTTNSALYGNAQIDLAISDVPASWFVKNTNSTGSWNAAPLTNGYGNGPLVSNSVVVGASGDQIGGQSNKLKSLTPNDPLSGTTALNLDGSVSSQQIHEYALAWVPIAYISNHGAGIDGDGDGTADGNITKSTLQHLFTTGRTQTGENLVAVTRDSGSGTRNGAMNSLGIDPSWGVGDNIGQKSKVGDNDDMGDSFVSTNKNSSSRLEDTVENHRLAVGYTGLVGSSKAAGHSLNNEIEILNVMNDIGGGTAYVRPMMDAGTTAAQNNVIFNGDVNTGWQAGGSESFYTIGSALSQDIYVAKGAMTVNGTSYSQGDVIAGGDIADLIASFNEDADKAGSGTGDYYLFAGDGSGDVAMSNPYAALYLRNILSSIADFTESPDDLDLFGTPGDALARGYSLNAAVSALPSVANAGVFEVNTDVNPALQASDVVATADMADAYGSVGYGRVSIRLDGTVYTDGVANGANYVTNNGTDVFYGTSMVSGGAAWMDRNEIAGDFDGDGDRDAADIDDMVHAYLNSLASGAANMVDGAGNTLVNRSNMAVTDGDAVLELLGDFDGDGNFDLNDVRYAADGLFVRSGGIDRKQNFIDVDNASVTGNLFNTSLATGKIYVAGDSRGDIAGSGDNASGWAPIGADGVVDDQDIDYVFAQFANEGDWDGDQDGKAEWALLNEAVFFDLSADMDGDLDVDSDDIVELVNNILGTEFGDANLDGVIDFLDVSSVSAGYGTSAGWAGGDFNGDGVVDFLDVSILSANFGFNSVATAEGLAALAELEALALVPEPGVLFVLGFGGVAVFSRRRR